jgi:fumarylacetoacetate (FAA) hydrolase
MKLASLRDGSRDGALALVSADLTRALKVPQIAGTLQAALDAWASIEPRLREAAARLEAGAAEGAMPFAASDALAPLPRAYQWVDASAYVTHVELVRKARGAEMPASFWTDPLFYQGTSDCNLGPTDPIPLRDPAFGCDFEGELAVITDDVPFGTEAAQAGPHIKLMVLLNDVTLRNLVPPELAKGFGFFQSKPQTAYAPVAVTLDELGDAWDGERVHLRLTVKRGDTVFGTPDAGRDMVFGFPRLIAHAARTRPLGAGTILGAGTVSNTDRSVGSACIAEQRALEMVEGGSPRTPFLAFGEKVSLEMFDKAGRSIFGRIEQVVSAA